MINFEKGKSNKRKGRGISGGQGKTAGRGTKGQNSRSGGGTRLGFEGGQNPLIKRLPKSRGFKTLRKDKVTVNTDQLLMYEGENFNLESLKKSGHVENKPYVRELKVVLGKKDITKKLSVEANKVSESAAAAIEKAGGTIKITEK